jgi:hypothetical protein
MVSALTAGHRTKLRWAFLLLVFGLAACAASKPPPGMPDFREQMDNSGVWLVDARTNCRIHSIDPALRAEWSGACTNGVAEGEGELRWWGPRGDLSGVYKGSFREGYRDGYAVVRWYSRGRSEPDGGHDGYYRRGIREGYGRSFNALGIYEGEFRAGLRNGKGEWRYPEGKLSYVGEFREHRMHGHGVYTFANGDRYEGEFAFSQAVGSGIYIWVNGDRFEGPQLKGKPNGVGTFTAKGGQPVQREFRDGQPVT